MAEKIKTTRKDKTSGSGYGNHVLRSLPVPEHAMVLTISLIFLLLMLLHESFTAARIVDTVLGPSYIWYKNSFILRQTSLIGFNLGDEACQGSA